MRLLLTSGGITNREIADSLFSLTDERPPTEVSIAVIPTAANVEEGNKKWFVEQNFTNFWKHGYDNVDIVDISAPGVDWRNRLTGVDVVSVSGGNTFHLLDQYRKTGFDDWLRQNLDRKVYLSVSAGTIVMAPNIGVADIEPADPNLPGIDDLTGVGAVPFEIEPHCSGERFQVIERYAKDRPNPVYAIDDQCAIQVVDDEATVVGGGEWQLYS
ncbi:MAG TPA: Type 1 glutamine amidotransferase-like domain-containing protein [Patescibacteria group bacterium]|nr:Type 1 glutamine amidotransferase-like domain-containing protein [Patescibacteria group bacterium]